MEEKFIIGQTAFEKIIKAVSKMNLLVGSTMGPNGSTVIIPDSTEFGKYKITKDGVSVAKMVKSSDEYEQVIINLIKEIANNTVKIAGDGTTTSIVLTAYFLEQLSKVANHKEGFKIFDECLESLIKHLDKTKIKLKHEDIDKVALISANGDTKIADMIKEAYKSSNVVHVEHSNKSEDHLEKISGLYVPSKKIVSYNITPEEVIGDTASVFVIDQNITKLSLIRDVIDQNIKLKGTIIIIANSVDEEILRVIQSNNDLGKTNVHFVKSPGFSTQRTKLLQDIAKYCNCELFTELDNTIEPKHTGKVDRFTIHPLRTSLTVFKNDVDTLINTLTKEYDEANDEHTQDLIKQRLDRLKGLSIIKVGGNSEAELNEKYDRYEDAVLSVACALEEGVIEGGGLALAKYAGEKLKELEFNPDNAIKDPKVLFYLALTGPSDTIVRNGTQLTIETDLIEQNIFDPVKVTKTALIQSYNFVKLLLTTKSIILTDGKSSFI